MTEPIVIVGSGGFGREILTLIEDLNAHKYQFEVIGFANTDQVGNSKNVDGLPVFGPEFFGTDVGRRCSVAIGIGHPQIRRRVVKQLGSEIKYPNLIHPSVIASRRVHYDGAGIVVTAGNILTTNIQLRSHIMINLACTVGHDTVIGDFSVLSPGVNISGCVGIGMGVSIGTGACVIEGTNIGDWSIVGAGAVVVRDVAPNLTVAGVPAVTIKTRSPGWHDSIQ